MNHRPITFVGGPKDKQTGAIDSNTLFLTHIGTRTKEYGFPGPIVVDNNVYKIDGRVAIWSPGMTEALANTSPGRWSIETREDAHEVESKNRSTQ